MTELPPDLCAWAELPGPAKFLSVLRDRLVNGGKAQGWLSLRRNPLSEDERRQLVELFGDRDDTVTVSAVHLTRAQERLTASRFPVILEELVAAMYGRVVTKSEAKRTREAESTAEVMRLRSEALTVMGCVPQLSDEYQLLAALPPSITNRVPVATRTRAGAWSSYSSAVHAAAEWWPRHLNGKLTTEKGLAATALGGSKRWTDAARLAFQNLVGVPFDQALQVSDTEIRLRGPLTWKLDDVIVDARTCHPWVSVPARGALKLGTIEGDPEGVLLIENHENFHQVCTNSDAPARWLCVWIKGFASDGLIAFVRKFANWKLAAWCDLDPSGIEIIQNVMRETGRDVHPVGMEPELWEIATKRWDSPADRRIWQARAETLASAGPSRLRLLASTMARTGERVEQEELAVYDRVIPTLSYRLSTVSGMR